jgi:hypothetical protein
VSAASDIADAGLAAAGEARIEWADGQMPVLRSVRERFARERPLEGMTVGACLHVTSETANLVRTLAGRLAELPGCEVLNDVVLNQVLLRFEDDEATDAVVAAIQAGGEAWLGGTVWDGRRGIRISVSNWRTSDEDVQRTVAAFEAARRVAATA